MVLMQKIMKCRDIDTSEYVELISELPEDFQDSYHRLLRWLVMFELLFCFAKRAVEGVDKLTKSHFEKLFDEENNVYY